MNVRWMLYLALGAASQVHAALDTTAQEIAMLPAYCDAKMGRQAPEAVAMWRDKMGFDNWIHMHHYCGGLIELNRYYRGATGRQTANLGNAVNEFSGMIKAWTPDFYLRPEAHLNRGRAYKFMHHDGQALVDFQKAIELDPRLAPASIELADLYKKLGKKNEALAVLKSGIEHNPDTKSLRRRYAELGGDPKALIIPAVPPAAATVPADPAASAGTAKPELAKPEAGSADAQPDPKSEMAEKPPVQLIEPKIGSPKNPYCRFCAD